MLYKNLLFDLANKKFEIDKQQLIENEKRILKNEVDTVLAVINQSRQIGYALAYDVNKNLLHIVTDNYKNYKAGVEKYFKNYYTEDLFFWYKTGKTAYPRDIVLEKTKIGRKIYTVTKHGGKKYLTVYKNVDGADIGIAFNLDIIKKTIQKNIFEFLDKINKDQVSYIALGKIDTWNPPKNGVFGEIIYAPEGLKNMIGRKISINKPDIKGNFFNKTYFRCFKNDKNCFVEYYFKNPKTGKYEKKISYFALYKPYNWGIMKGIYISQIENIVERTKNKIFSNVKELFTATFLTLILIAVLSILITYYVGNIIATNIVCEYEKLKNNYEKAREDLIKRYYFDSLTRLPNRNKLLDDVKNYKALVLMDVDNFSDINDIYGFEFGNKILRFVAEYLKENFENVYRVGSDEFAVAFKENIDYEDFKRFTDMKLSYFDIKINFTIGASNIKNKLFETAETALKFALKSTKKNFVLYDKNMEERQKVKLSKIQTLHKILEKDGILPYYQCIVDKEGKTLKYESLMRLKLDGEIYPPYYFMDILKDSKLYDKFSTVMIEKVFKDMKKIEKTVSVNLSYEDIQNDDTRNFICSYLKNNKMDVVFEILETENIEHFGIVIDFINCVKKYGAKIAIDDFGSGYSNFVNLLMLNPDYIKIDGTLVKNVKDGKYKDIIKLIVDFNKKFNLKTIAEFVSDEEKFLLLKELGVDEFQGFYFCEPKPLEEILKN